MWFPPETPEQLQRIRQLKQKIVFNCPECHGSRIIEHDDLVVECKCFKRFERFAYYVLANLPEETWIQTLDSYLKRGGDEEVAKTVQEFIFRFELFYRNGVGPLFWGGYAKGKTTLACIIAKAAIEKEVMAYFYPVSELVDDMVKREGRWGEIDRAEFIVENVPLLVLDDFGKEDRDIRRNLDVKIRVKMDKILRARTSRRLLTIGSTNLDAGNAQELYGASVFSVVQSSLKFINVKGQDLRIGVANAKWRQIMELPND